MKTARVIVHFGAWPASFWLGVFWGTSAMLPLFLFVVSCFVVAYLLAERAGWRG